MEYFRGKQRPFIIIMRGFRKKLAIIRLPTLDILQAKRKDLEKTKEIEFLKLKY